MYVYAIHVLFCAFCAFCAFIVNLLTSEQAYSQDAILAQVVKQLPVGLADQRLGQGYLVHAAAGHLGGEVEAASKGREREREE